MLVRSAASRELAPALAGYDIWPNLNMVDPAGVEFQISQLGTPLVFVNVWAHWCAACLNEMASLHSMVGKLTPGRITVLLLSHPSNWTADQQAAARRQLPFRLATLAPSPAWVRPAAFEERGSTYSVPRSLLYDHVSHGVVMSHDGPAEWDSAPQISRLNRLLG